IKHINRLWLHWSRKFRSSCSRPIIYKGSRESVLLIVQYGERNCVRRTAKQSNLCVYGENNMYGCSPYRATFVRLFAVHDFFVLLATLRESPVSLASLGKVKRKTELKSEPG